MELRQATVLDLEGIRRLVADVGREYGFEPEPEGADLDLYGEVRAYFGGASLFEVLERGGVIVGVVGVVPQSQTTYELRKLYLTRGERSHGYGRRMALRAIQFAAERGAEKLVLQSSVKLKEALALYRSLGFVETPSEGRSPTCDLAMELAL